jgi:hypothetical protein
VLGGRLVGGAGGVPGQGGGALGPAGHGGAQVLDRLELADHSAELPAGPGVVDGSSAAPGSHARGLRGAGGRGQVADPGRGEQQAGQGGGQDRAGDKRDGKLLQGGGQVGQRAAGATGGLGDRDREQAEAGQVAHVAVLGRDRGAGLEAADRGERGSLPGPVAEGRL